MLPRFAVLFVFLGVCSSLAGFAMRSALASDPGAATSEDGNTFFDQACADRVDQNEIFVGFSPSNATLYVGGSLQFRVDVCLAPDASVGVALEDEDGVVDDRFDVATINTQGIQSERITFYLHCHRAGVNYLEGHQGSSFEEDNYLHIDLINYVSGDQQDLLDNHGATQGPAHVQCLSPPVGGVTELARPLLVDEGSGPNVALIAAITSGALVLVTSTVWWARRWRGARRATRAER
jgi:hypothetical protein